MKHLSSALIVSLVVMTACGDGPTVGPASMSSPDRVGSAAPTPGVPAQPAYTVTGYVTDLRAGPVAGAEIWIYDWDSPIDNRYGIGFTDETGRYSVTSATRTPHMVRAIKDGYVRRDVPIRGSTSSSTWSADVTLVHIDRYELVAPAAIAVGGRARLQARVDLDDGSTQTGLVFLELSSSHPSILLTESNGWITGIAPGTATSTARYYGATSARLIRVDAAE